MCPEMSPEWNFKKYAVPVWTVGFLGQNRCYDVINVFCCFPCCHQLKNFFYKIIIISKIIDLQWQVKL
jgi:hypothetical protein